ncbi:hypothetical protein D3C75_870000 [compost metagenome]
MIQRFLRFNSRTQQVPAKAGQIRTERQRLGRVNAVLQPAAADKSPMWQGCTHFGNTLGGRNPPIGECFCCCTPHWIGAAEFLHLAPGGSSRTRHIDKSGTGTIQPGSRISVDAPADLFHTYRNG